MNIVAAIIALGLAAMVAPGLARSATDPIAEARTVAQKTLALEDTNGDHLISTDENNALVTALFASTDANKDGIISRQEMLRATVRDMASLRISKRSEQTAKMVAVKMQIMDQNGDDGVSLSELQAVSMRIFQMADLNGDGFLSEDEMLSQMLGRVTVAQN